jgi:hypothetical protein
MTRWHRIKHDLAAWFVRADPVLWMVYLLALVLLAAVWECYRTMVG